MYSLLFAALCGQITAEELLTRNLESQAKLAEIRAKIAEMRDTLPTQALQRPNQGYLAATPDANQMLPALYQAIMQGGNGDDPPPVALPSQPPQPPSQTPQLPQLPQQPQLPGSPQLGPGEYDQLVRLVLLSIVLRYAHDEGLIARIQPVEQAPVMTVPTPPQQPQQPTTPPVTIQPYPVPVPTPSVDPRLWFYAHFQKRGCLFPRWVLRSPYDPAYVYYHYGMCR